MPDTLHFFTNVTVLSSSNPTTQLLHKDNLLSRQYLAVQNTGPNPVTIGYSSGITAGQGITLQPGSTLTSASTSSTGLQGGVWELTRTIPSNNVFAYSASGTTVVVLSG